MHYFEDCCMLTTLLSGRDWKMEGRLKEYKGDLRAPPSMEVIAQLEGKKKKMLEIT